MCGCVSTIGFFLVKDDDPNVVFGVCLDGLVEEVAVIGSGIGVIIVVLCKIGDGVIIVGIVDYCDRDF